VNVELVSGYLTIRQPREIAMYSQVFAELAEIAVYGPEARARVVSALETSTISGAHLCTLLEYGRLLVLASEA
jgi:hypothetical protein